MIVAPIIGHRGAAGLAPENTLAAVRAAAAIGIDWIEVDVQLCADGTPVIFHDAALERCTDGHGMAAEHRFSELARLDAGSHFDARFRGEPIPSLDDLLAVCSELHVGVNLELKLHPGRDPTALAEGVMATLARCRPAVDKILLSSFDRTALQVCRSRDSEVLLGLICNTWPADLAAASHALRLASLHPHCGYLQSGDVERAQSSGLELYAWTVNEMRQARLLWALGVDGIMTDYPQRFVGGA